MLKLLVFVGNVKMQDMKKIGLKILAPALALLLIFSCTPKDPGEVIKRVDAKIYYPDKAGLSSLYCQVTSPYIAEMFSRLKNDIPGSERILDQIKLDITYYWRGDSGSKFLIKGVPEELSALRRSIYEVFNGTDILIMPPSEEKQFEAFTLSLLKEKGKLEVSGVNPDRDSDFREYHLVVNPKDWMILQRRFVAKNFASNSVPAFELYKGKRYPVKIETVQDAKDGPGFKSLVEISYQELGGYWLVKKLTYSFTMADTGEKAVGPVELNFENCRINPLLSPDFFKDGKVKFESPEPGARLIPQPQKPEPKSPAPKPKTKTKTKK